MIILKITILKLTDVFKMRVHFKGNAQFLFLCNPPKLDVSQVACITFFQVTQKILTKDIFHWLKVIIEILSFPQIISMKKQPLSFFNISKSLQKNCILGTCWAFKSKLQSILAATYIALFPPDSNNCSLYV